MKKPSEVSCTDDQWAAFVEACEESGVNLEDFDDWYPWWEFFEAGLNYSEDR